MVSEYMNMDEVVAMVRLVQPEGCQLEGYRRSFIVGGRDFQGCSIKHVVAELIYDMTNNTIRTSRRAEWRMEKAGFGQNLPARRLRRGGAYLGEVDDASNAELSS